MFLSALVVARWSHTVWQ